MGSMFKYRWAWWDRSLQAALRTQELGCCNNQHGANAGSTTACPKGDGYVAGLSYRGTNMGRRTGGMNKENASFEMHID